MDISDDYWGAWHYYFPEVRLGPVRYRDCCFLAGTAVYNYTDYEASCITAMG